MLQILGQASLKFQQQFWTQVVSQMKPKVVSFFSFTFSCYLFLPAWILLPHSEIKITDEVYDLFQHLQSTTLCKSECGDEPVILGVRELFIDFY